MPNQLELMLEVADNAVELSKDDLHRLIMQLCKRVPMADLITVAVESRKPDEITRARVV